MGQQKDTGRAKIKTFSSSHILHYETTWYFLYRILSSMIINYTNLTFSLWHFASALQRFGSGQRSSGDWPFLFRMLRSAPLAAKKQAIDAALFFSAPWVPSPIINCNKIKRVMIFPLGICHQFLPSHICICVCVGHLWLPVLMFPPHRSTPVFSSIHTSMLSLVVEVDLHSPAAGVDQKWPKPVRYLYLTYMASTGMDK